MYTAYSLSSIYRGTVLRSSAQVARHISRSRSGLAQVTRGDARLRHAKKDFWRKWFIRVFFSHKRHFSYLLFSCLNSSTCLSSHRCFASSSREPTLQASCTPSSQSSAANDSDSEPHKSGSRLARRDRIHLCMRLVAAERGVSRAVATKGSNGRPNVSTCARNASAALD